MYYQTLFNGALAGLNSSGLMPGILKIASVILMISLLYSVYTAYTAGGDVRILGTAAIKYLILGLVLVNYAAAFGDVNNMFNGLANHIVSTGPGIGDVFESWSHQIAAYWQVNVSGTGGRSVDASQSSSSTPPQPPVSSSGPGGERRGVPAPWQPGYNMPGHRPAFSFTHAASWYGGYTARAVYNRMKGSGGDEQS